MGPAPSSTPASSEDRPAERGGPSAPLRATDALAELERKVGGRLGVFALDTQTGRQVHHRPDERFALCSTFKWLLAAQVLELVDRQERFVEQRIPFGPGDLLDHSPVTQAHMDEGALSLEALAEAAVVVSDNAAANLLLAEVGGPAAFTAFLRLLGDDVTRLDRNEPSLNANEPGDPRDTTSPRAMVALARTLLVSERLSSASRERLLGWLTACETGSRRLRAGLPPNWKAGDKTGTGNRGACNDVAIVWPPGRAPVLIASYASDGAARLEELEATHAEVARIVMRELLLG